MLKKGEIKKITRGFYTTHEEPSLLVFCFKPSYLGLQNALSIHGLWEQETNPIVITINKIRQGVRDVFGNNAVIKRIDKKYFFGFEFLKYGDFYFPVSDVDKTFIDMAYYGLHMDKELIIEFKKRINKKRLKSYLNKYPKRFRRKFLEILK